MKFGFAETGQNRIQAEQGEHLGADFTDLPNNSEKRDCRADLPDDSGEKVYNADLPDDRGESLPQTKDINEGVTGNQFDGPKGLEDQGPQDSEIKSKAIEIKQYLELLLNDYFKELKKFSDCPDTIPNNPFSISDLERLRPNEVAKQREEFTELKPDLKKQWEEENGRSWPKYTEDVYSANGKLIRKAGDDYDMHHIQPLCMGGKNVVSNITPLHAEVHYDKQGIHSVDSAYSKIDKILRSDGVE